MSNKAIKSSAIVMILIILGKVFALIRDSMIAAKFGVTYMTDIYTFALGMVYLVTTISYGLTTTFIPVHSQNLEEVGKEEANRFVNKVLNVSTIFTMLITVLLIVFSKYIIYIFAHGFTKTPEVFSTATYITRIMIISLIFLNLQSVITAVLQVHKQFYEPSAMAAVSNLIYIAYLVILASLFGIKGFAVATVVGFFAQFIINVPKYKKLGYNYKLIIDFKDSSMFKMFKLMIPIVISTSVVQLNIFVNRSFATNLYFGAPTILDCANKINTLAYEVFAIGISMIVYPTLSELVAKKDNTQYKQALTKAINTITIIMVPAAVAIAVLRDPLITIIFKRGAFTASDAALTSSALLLYAPAMIAYGIRDVLNKAFYSIKDSKTPMVNSFLTIILNVIINIAVMRYMKVAGLTLGASIAAIVSTLILIIQLNKRLRGIGYRDLLEVFLKVSAASVVMAGSIFIINFVSMKFIGANLKGSIVSLAFSFIIGSGVHFLAIMLFKVKEFNYLLQMLKSKRA